MIAYYYSKREGRIDLELLDTGRKLNVHKTFCVQGNMCICEIRSSSSARTLSKTRISFPKVFWKIAAQKKIVIKSSENFKMKSCLGSSIKYIRKIFRKTNISNPVIRRRTCVRFSGLEMLVFRKILRTYLMGRPFIRT